MFSPYYAWRGRGRPEDHCALNVALYGPRARLGGPVAGMFTPWNRWSMTERPARAARREAARYDLGPSRLTWEDDALTVAIDETAVPHLSRLKGRVRIRPPALGPETFALDPEGRHFWRPIAPRAAIEVALERPALSWSGAGYLDANWGVEPLEARFRRWDWSRAALPGDAAAILYDAERRDGSTLSLGLRWASDGALERFAPPERRPLPKTLFGLRRFTQADGPVREARRLEDAPFYARAELETRLFGVEAPAVHESLDLDRFAQRWVKLMLPWRMPRALFAGRA